MTVVEVDFARGGRVDAPAERLWDVLLRPVDVARLVPGVRRIDEQGDRWDWTLEPVSALGFEFVPSFQVSLSRDRPRRIEFVPAGETAQSGVEARGAFDLRPIDDGATRLSVVLNLAIDLGIPRMLRRPARRMLGSELAETAEGFIANLRREVAV